MTTLSLVPEPHGYLLGVDVGQSQDYTAIAILDRELRPSDVKTDQGLRWDDHYTVRHLERPPLKTAYPDIVDRVAQTRAHPRLRGKVELVVDATGVGRPVVDMLRDRGCEPRPVTIHGGTETTEVDGYWRVPKRDLVGSMAVALQTKRLHVVKSLKLAETLSREMRNFKVKISQKAHDSYEAWREGEHDDLVLAVALAVWWGEKTARGGFRLLPNEDMKEKRRLAYLAKKEEPWWKQRAPIDRGERAFWRR